MKRRKSRDGRAWKYSLATWTGNAILLNLSLPLVGLEFDDDNTQRNGPPVAELKALYRAELVCTSTDVLIVKGEDGFWWGTTESAEWFPVREDHDSRFSFLEDTCVLLMQENAILKETLLRLVEFVTTEQPSDRRYDELVSAASRIGYSGPVTTIREAFDRIPQDAGATTIIVQPGIYPNPTPRIPSRRKSISKYDKKRKEKK